MRQCLFILTYVTLTALYGCKSSPTERTAKVTHGHKYLAVVNFNAPWTGRDKNGTFILRKPEEIIFERAIGTPLNQLVVSVKGINAQSNNKFAVSFDDSSLIRQISQNNTLQLEEIHPPESFIERNVYDTKDEGYEYQGKIYPVTGRVLHTVLRSQSGKWLTLLSYTKESGKSIEFFWSMEFKTGKGTFYCEIYDTFTGEKVAAGQAPYGEDTSLSMFFLFARWLDDQHFIMPLNSDFNIYLIGSLPRD